MFFSSHDLLFDDKLLLNYLTDKSEGLFIVLMQWGQSNEFERK